MNLSNKDGKPLAESAEERPLIKENARQPNTYPTSVRLSEILDLMGTSMAAVAHPEKQP